MGEILLPDHIPKPHGLSIENTLKNHGIVQAFIAAIGLGALSILLDIGILSTVPALTVNS